MEFSLTEKQKMLKKITRQFAEEYIVPVARESDEKQELDDGAFQKMKEMKIGEVLEVLSTDKGIIEDMPAWCRQTGQEFLGVEEEEDIFKAYVKKVRD